MNLKLIFVATVVLCLVALSFSHRWRRRRNRSKSNRFYIRKYRRFNYKRYDRHNDWQMFQDDPCRTNRWKHEDTKVIACEFSSSTSFEKRLCPQKYNCTAGPLTVKIGNENATFKFCNRPPSFADACKMRSSTFEMTKKKCPPGVFCEAGPIRMYQWLCPTDFYFCGKANSSIPGVHFYESELTNKACEVNGLAQESDCSVGMCDGMTLTLSTNTLRFCNGPTDANFTFVSLWGTVCIKGTPYNPTIVTTVPGSTNGGNVTTPSANQPPGEPSAGELPQTSLDKQNSTLVEE